MMDLQVDIRTDDLPDTTSIKLTQIQGNHIREYILQNTNLTWKDYCAAVGLQPSNCYRYLSGEARISKRVLHKLLSGIETEISWTLEVAIGSIAEGAISIEQDVMSSLEEAEGQALLPLDMEMVDSPYDSSLLERHPERSRMQQGSPFGDPPPDH